MKTPEQVMEQCQIGTRNYDDANNLHAECYGTIGKLLHERERLVGHVNALINCADHSRDMCEIRAAKAYLRELERICNSTTTWRLSA